MALNIDNKVYRTLQEEVGWLSTTVAEIIKVTDVNTLADYVNQFSSWSDSMDAWSDTMTDYANTMNDYATTMNGYSNTMNDYANTMAGYASQVNTWTNNIAGSVLSVISANTITPLSVRQTQTYWKATGSFTMGSVLSGYATMTNVYCVIQEINQRLSCIVNLKIDVTADRTINPNSFLASWNTGNLPSEIGSKIYDFDGVAVSSAISAKCLIAATKALCLVGTAETAAEIDGVICRIDNSTSANQLSFAIQAKQSMNLQAGNSYCITARIFLDLL